MEKLIQEIMKDLDCSREDAEEIAKMELKAKGLKRYEQSDKPRMEKVQRERKVDEVKKEIIDELVACISKNIGKVTKVKTETEIDFMYADEDFTLKLTRHRKKK